jgi:hypothetical protein
LSRNQPLLLALLEDRNGAATLRQQASDGETRRPAAEDDDIISFARLNSHSASMNFGLSLGRWAHLLPNRFCHVVLIETKGGS